MIGFNGGLIGGFRDTAGVASVPGVWTANEQVVARRSGQWLNSDPFFSSVSLLLPGDGTNGSTSIIDRSPSPKTITAFGNAQISTAQSVFGGSSLAFDGNGDYLVPATSSDLIIGTSDYTVELWIYFLSVKGVTTVIGSPSSNSLQFYTNLQLGEIVFSNRVATEGTWSFSFVINTWYHLALTRNSQSTRVFVNGSQVGNAVLSNTNYSSQISRIGGEEFTGWWQHAHFDDLRITKGVARYTTNFTPPTAPHPLF